MWHDLQTLWLLVAVAWLIVAALALAIISLLRRIAHRDATITNLRRLRRREVIQLRGPRMNDYLKRAMAGEYHRDERS